MRAVTRRQNNGLGLKSPSKDQISGDCAICLNELKEEEEEDLVVTGCPEKHPHVFHRSCLEAWDAGCRERRAPTACPNCRHCLRKAPIPGSPTFAFSVVQAPPTHYQGRPDFFDDPLPVRADSAALNSSSAPADPGAIRGEHYFYPQGCPVPRGEEAYHVGGGIFFRREDPEDYTEDSNARSWDYPDEDVEGLVSDAGMEDDRPDW